MVRNRNLIIIFCAVVAGILAFFLTLRALGPAKETVKNRFLVVSLIQDLEKGSVIRKEDLDVVPMPDGMNPELVYMNAENVIGKVLNRDLPSGSIVRSLDILSESDSIAGLIPQGYQAITFPVTLPSNLTNLVQVGVRVDVLLTYKRDGKEFKSIVLMRNIRVIGVTKTEGSSTLHVTIAVTADGAKTLSYALQKGVLNIAVRSLSEVDKEQPETFYKMEQIFKDQELDDYRSSMTKMPIPTEEIEIIRGLNRETYRFVDRKGNLKQS